jgi:hypothetical protein
MNVYIGYRAQLNAYSKNAFDPFRRRNRIGFIFPDGTEVETTIGQLNFFRWIINNNILQYVENNFDVIEADMFANLGSSHANNDVDVDVVVTKPERVDRKMLDTVVPHVLSFD